MAQSVKRPTLGFGSGRDLAVREIEPHVGLCSDGVEPAWDSLSHILCPSPTCSVSLSVKINKHFFKKGSRRKEGKKTEHRKGEGRRSGKGREQLPVCRAGALHLLLGDGMPHSIYLPQRLLVSNASQVEEACEPCNQQTLIRADGTHKKVHRDEDTELRVLPAWMAPVWAA